MGFICHNLKSFGYTVQACLLLAGACMLPASAWAQLPPDQPEQDCFFAIPVCQDIYVQNNSYTGAGRNPDEINGAYSCMLIGERNSVWYTFEVRQPGDLCFTIIPVDPLDDYDWALFDLTNNTCANIPVNPNMEVRCNWEFNSGCNGETGPNGRTDCPLQMEACIPVVVGQRFALNVSNFTASNAGYTLDFTPSTARLYDDEPPAIESVTSFCTGVTVRFDENVLCGTVDSLDFVFSGPGGPFTISRVASANCDRGGAYDREFDLYITPGIPTAGLYTLTLAGSITDFCGNVASPVANSIFMPMPPTASITPPGPAQCIESNEFVLTYNGPSSVRFYDWDFGDSTRTMGPQPRKTYTRPGPRTVTLVITDVNGCRDTATTNLNVLGNANAAFTLPPSFCETDTLVPVNTTTAGAGTAITGYRWFFGDGNVSLQQNPQHIYATPGIREVLLAVTNQSGCIGVARQTLNVNPAPEVDFVKEEDVCFGDTARFSAMLVVPNFANDLLASWSWDFGNGLILGSVESPSVLYDSAGVYPVTLTATTNKGCARSFTQHMTIHQPPPPFAPGDTACIGEPAFLTAQPLDGGLISWYDTPTDTALIHNLNSFFTEPLFTTRSYFVTTTSDIGCVSERAEVIAFVPPFSEGRIAAQDSILYYPLPTANLSLEGTIEGARYLWTFGEGGTATDAAPVYEYLLPGRYEVGLTVIDIYGCDHVLSRFIEVRPPNDVFVPSAFTPNGDGYNDFLSISAPVMNSFRFTLFDRFGSTLFEVTETEFVWDGRGPGGNHVPEGVYAYLAEGVNLAGIPVQVKGTVTLLR